MKNQIKFVWQWKLFKNIIQLNEIVFLLMDLFDRFRENSNARGAYVAAC